MENSNCQTLPLLTLQLEILYQTELELYISKQDNIFTENVITEFKKAGMVKSSDKNME